jgi:glycosyltransferase involved in cell wall biosynthesis
MVTAGRDAPTDPIPILLLVATLDRGGAEKILTRLALGLSREKYAMRVAALQGRSGAIAADLARAGIPVHDLGMRGKADLRGVVRLVRLLRRARVRVLFSFMFHATLLGRLVGAGLRVPIRISSERSMGGDGFGRRLLNRWTVPLATQVVAVSERVAAYASREFRIPSDRLTTIVNGVDLTHFRPSPRTRHPKAPVIGCTARLHAENDHVTLLHAFASLVDRWPNAQLLLVGRGQEEPRLRALAEAPGVRGRIRFAGEQADVAPWLAQMDVYVQPSLTAGISNSILEAMACGLPVVATAVGGTVEVVADGETGLLVPPGDPVAMAEALERLLADPARVEAVGRAGRARAEAHFGETLMLQRVEALLDQLIRRELHIVFEPASGWVAG